MTRHRSSKSLSPLPSPRPRSPRPLRPFIRFGADSSSRRIRRREIRIVFFGQSSSLFVHTSKSLGKKSGLIIGIPSFRLVSADEQANRLGRPAPRGLQSARKKTPLFGVQWQKELLAVPVDAIIASLHFVSRPPRRCSAWRASRGG